MQRWDFEKRKYEPYEVPEDWHVSFCEADPEIVINCADCGKTVSYLDAYNSKAILNEDYDTPYYVCEECSKKEWVQIGADV